MAGVRLRGLPPLKKGETWSAYWQRYFVPTTMNEGRRPKRAQFRR